MEIHTWLFVLCLVFFRADSVISASFQHQYEWVHYGRLPHYSQDIDFSLLSFTIPAHTTKAEFYVMLMNGPTDDDGRKILLSLRRQAIPVLQAYNETKPESFFLPTDQQIFETKNETSITLTMNSPAPGQVYLVATELNPLSEVIDNLQWGQKMSGRTFMSVTANYTIRTSVTPLSMDGISKISSGDGPEHIYSFRVPDFTMSYSAIINNCLHNNGSGSGCPVTMMTANSLFEDDNSSVSVDCRQQGSQCVLNVSSPVLEQDHYVTFTFEHSEQDQNVTFDFSFDIQGCKVKAIQYSGWKGMSRDAFSLEAMPVMMYPDDYTGVDDASYSETSGDLAGPISLSAYRNLTGIQRYKPGSSAHNPFCINLGYLDRQSNPSRESSFSFNADFGVSTTEGDIIRSFVVVVPDFSTEVRTFSLQESLDSGGTLSIRAQFQNQTWQGLVWLCATAHRLPLNGSVDRCPNGVLLTLNSTANDTADDESTHGHAFIPFPTSGSWYLAMQSQCSGSEPCKKLPKVQLSVSLEQCVPNDCGRYGYCQIYTDANVVFAGCICLAGYRGLLCNDDQYSLTDAEQLRAVYLLTLSNLAFVPAIFLALYRRHFTLAAIFFFNAFFSAFYHACDTSKVFQKCIMDYNTLAFCDFFGSILSFYAVLLYMARLPDCCRAFLLVGGALVIAVFQNDDRHSDLAHIMPLAVAGGILIISWILVMWKRRQLFPSRRRYLFFLLPGVVLAVTGIGVNYGLMSHQSTYQYTHSFWHVSLMIAPCLLMPPRSNKSSDSKKGLSISAQDIIRSGHHEQSEPLLIQQDEDEPAMFDASMNSINTGQNLLI